MIYVLMAWQGSYEDYHVYPLKAYKSRSKTNEVLEKIEAQSNSFKKLNVYCTENFKNFHTIEKYDFDYNNFGFRIKELELE